MASHHSDGARCGLARSPFEGLQTHHGKTRVGPSDVSHLRPSSPGDAVGRAWDSEEARRALAWAGARDVREASRRTLLGAFQDFREDGVVDPALNFTNPLRMLQLAYGCSSPFIGPPLDIVIAMLGLPSYHVRPQARMHGAGTHRHPRTRMRVGMTITNSPGYS